MPEVTLTINSVDDKDTKKGTIFVAHASDGNEYNTKHSGMASTLKGASSSGSQVSLEYTILPGRERDDGSRWPDSRWIDKDGVTVVGGASASPAATGSAPRSGGMSEADIRRVTRLSAMSSACSLFAGRQEAPTPTQLKTLADYIVDYAFGRLDPEADVPPTPDDKPADDDIPF